MFALYNHLGSGTKWLQISRIRNSIWTNQRLYSLPPFDRKRRFRLTQTPCPEWKYGDGLTGEEWSMDRKKVWDMENTSPRDTYRLMTSAIVPRPIAFVSTLSSDNVPNLAPFSYFSMVSHSPPMISVSFSLSKRRPKDTRENILQTKEFTVNIISEPFIEAANVTSVECPAEMDEWPLAGLTRGKSVHVKPPLVEESAVSLECELYSHQDISTEPVPGPPTTTVVLGLIKKIHVRESCLEDDGLTVDVGKLRVVGRLGGVIYGRIVEGFELNRVNWKDIR